MSPRIVDALRARRRKPAASTTPQASDWMPLAVAAEQVRAAQRGSDLDRISQGLSENEDSLQAFWARQVVQLGVPVYGSRIASTKREVVPEADLMAGRLTDGTMRLETSRGEPVKDFCDLQVKRVDLEACLARLDAAALGRAAD